MMTEYINKDFYKQIPPKERHYLNVSSEAAKLFMERLKAANIQFSATLSEYKNTVTVFKADSERANEILRSVSEEKTRQSRKIIGNTDYRFISDKKYINTDAQTALQIATILSGDGSNRFSGIIDGNKATITVSGEKNAASVRRMVDNIRHMDLINELNSAGFERIADSNGFVNIRNNATGVVTGFDGMETVKVMFNDPDNEFFHPAAYRIELTSDAFGDPYYISEYDISSGDEKSSYHNSMGDTPTFVTVNEAVEYARSNNISITNSAEQLNDWKNIDDERELDSIAKENAQLILQFPMKDGGYPDYIRYNEQKECFDWFYFNPDGDDGKGEFEVRTVYMQDIYAAYAARSTAGSKSEGRNAFLSYLYSNCENEIIDTYSGYFADYAQDSITPPENMSVYYGIAENSNATAIDDFIMLLSEKASIAIIDDKAEKEHIMQEKSEHKEDSPVGNLVYDEDIALSEQLIELTNEITKKQAEFTGFISEGNYDMASSAAAELAEMSKRAEEIKAHIKYSELDKAKEYISDFLESEYQTVPSDDDFKDLQHISIGYTTLGDNEEYQLQLEADLIDYEIRYMIDGKTVMTDNYDSLEEMNENTLSVLNFDELVSTANDYIEQNMEQEAPEKTYEPVTEEMMNIIFDDMPSFVKSAVAWDELMEYDGIYDRFDKGEDPVAVVKSYIANKGGFSYYADELNDYYFTWSAKDNGATANITVSVDDKITYNEMYRSHFELPWSDIADAFKKRIEQELNYNKLSDRTINVTAVGEDRFRFIDSSSGIETVESREELTARFVNMFNKSELDGIINTVIENAPYEKPDISAENSIENETSESEQTDIIHNAFLKLKNNHDFSPEAEKFLDRVEKNIAINHKEKFDPQIINSPLFRTNYGSVSKIDNSFFDGNLKAVIDEVNGYIVDNSPVGNLEPTYNNVFEWKEIPESIEEDTGKPTLWSTEISSENYGKFIWISMKDEHSFDIEYAYGDKFLPVSEDSTGFYSMADAAEWAENNLTDILSVPEKEQHEEAEQSDELSDLIHEKNLDTIQNIEIGDEITLHGETFIISSINDSFMMSMDKKEPNSSGMDTISRQFIGNWRNQLVDEAGNEPIIVVKANKYVTEQLATPKEEPEQAQRSYADFGITQADIDVLRTLPPRKSILNFTDEEKTVTEKWAVRFEDDIAEKSPYFRAENGDWRAEDNTRIPVIELEKKDISFAQIKEEVKSGIIERGNVINSDTKWNITISRKGLEDTIRYADKHNDNAPYNLLEKVNYILENSVLLDSQISDDNKNNKANSTGIMHKLYAAVKIGNEPYIAKSTVEEFFNGNIKNPDTLKRLYNLQDIKIEPLKTISFTGNRLHSAIFNGTDISISDLFEVVKSCDKDFYTNSPDYALAHKGKSQGTYEIYQIPSGERYRDIRFESMEHLNIMGQLPDRLNYEKVYSGRLDDIEYDDKPEGIFVKFNMNRPEDFEGHSLSVSDVIVIEDENGRTAHYVDDVGFKNITDIFLEHERKEQTVEQLNINDYENIRLVSRSEWDDYTLGDDENPAFEEISVSYTPDEDGSFTKYAHNTTNSSLVDVWDEENSVSADDLLEDIANHLKKMGQDKSNRSYHIELADYDGNSRKLDSNNFSFVMEDKQREQSEMAAPDVELEKSVEEGIIGSMGYPIDEMDKAFEAENSRADYDNEAEPARKKSGSEVEVGDVFLYNDREYTVTSEKGIYPDDVGVSYEDKAGNTSYLTTQNVNRYKLAENGIFLGNPEKEKQKEKSQEMFERWGEQYSELTNSLDFDIIIHQSRNIVNAKKEIFEKSDVEEKNSPVGNTEKSFSEQVDEVLNGTADRYNDLKVCDTPQILIDIGCKQLPMFYTKKHLRDALKPKGNRGESIHYHGLDKEQIKKMPDLLSDPVMIYDSLSSSRNDSIVVVTSELDKDNLPIIAAIRPNGKAKYDLEIINSNFVLSFHGREHFDNQLTHAFNEDKILYINKQKSQELFSVLGLQLSEGLNNLDSNVIIHQSRNIVNTQNEKSSQKTITEQQPENSPVGNKIGANSYEPKIGDLIEYQDTLFKISDVRGSNVTLQTADTLIPQTTVVSVSKLITSDSLNVIEENGKPAPAKAAAPVKESEAEQPSEEKPKAQNFVITDENFGVAGGAKTRYADNVEAIKTLKAIEAENRTATPEEQKILSKYTGWGAIPQAFDIGNDKWRTEYAELRTLLTPDEYAAARKSTMNAHYTSPTVISAIYDGLKNIGFEQGKILEPAVGIGNFFGAIPEEMRNSKLYGVELDSLTGRIAQQLYPEADIQIKGFEETAFADNSFDVAIGNVPFGDYKLNDHRYNENNFLIHDYFFAKALDKVHPGGVVAFVTSKGTLDKENSEVRKYIAQRAELLGAIRLPNNAFKANAGTEVTSDIIFLQKRERPIEINPDEVEWLKKAETPDGFSVNNYFVQHPEMVLGKITEGNKMYGNAGKDTSCIPIEGADLKQQLAEAMKNISGKYRAAEKETAPQNVDEVPAPANSRKYSFYAVDGNLYYREAEDTMKKVNVSKDTLNRAVGLIELRDNIRELLDLQLNNSDGTLDGDISASREKLNKAYDSFVAKYGNVSNRKNAKAMQGDDGYNIVSALEVKDEKGQVTGKADIFTHNTVKPKIIASHVDSAEEALILSVAEKAKVDFEFMSELCGMDKDKLISELSGQIFRLPQEEEKYVTADEYLTGNIRKKLRELENAPDDMDVSENRKALEAAMPPRVEAKDISVKLGAHWVDPMYIQQFICETFNPEWRTRTDINVQYSSVAGTWKIEGVSPNAKNNYAATHTYGTKRKNAYEIIEGILNNGDLQVKDRVKDEYGHDLRDANGRYVLVVNAEETKAARHCANVIKSEFQDWIFKDPDRREALVQKYNEVYNSIRHREYDGSHLNFVGMNTDITLKEHQKNAVARGLYGGNSLLAHAVGAGKTFEMIAIAMEGKRLGLHNKCLFAVPNALTEQMGNDFRKLYPNANILVATQKDFERQNRLQLLGRIAANDWDAVIVGHSQFDRMGLSPEKEKMYLTAEVEKLREELEKAADENGGKKSFTVKQIEKSIANYEDKLEKLNDAQVKDGFIDFEQLGFDKVFVDESHMYKNLATATKMHNVSGLGTQGSARAFNLLMKSKYLDELTGGRGLTFASGTPIITGYQRLKMPILRCLSKRASHFMVMLLLFISEYSILCIGIIRAKNNIGCDYYVRLLSCAY